MSMASCGRCLPDSGTAVRAKSRARRTRRGRIRSHRPFCFGRTGEGVTIDSGQTLLWLGTIALVAAIVNGGLGYGFSSITVPLALLFLTSRVLNPALVLVGVAINFYVLFVNWP